MTIFTIFIFKKRAKSTLLSPDSEPDPEQPRASRCLCRPPRTWGRVPRQRSSFPWGRMVNNHALLRCKPASLDLDCVSVWPHVMSSRLPCYAHTATQHGDCVTSMACGPSHSPVAFLEGVSVSGLCCGLWWSSHSLPPPSPTPRPHALSFLAKSNLAMCTQCLAASARQMFQTTSSIFTWL